MRRSLFEFKLVKHCQSAHLQWSASGFFSPIVFLFLVFAIAIPAIPILSHPFLSFRSVVVVTKEPSVASMRCSSACVLGMIRTMSWPLEPKQDAMFHAIETAPGVLRGASFFWDKGWHCIARFYQRCTCFFWRSVVISSDSFLRILWSVQTWHQHHRWHCRRTCLHSYHLPQRRRGNWAA